MPSRNAAKGRANAPSIYEDRYTELRNISRCSHGQALQRIVHEGNNLMLDRAIWRLKALQRYSVSDAIKALEELKVGS